MFKELLKSKSYLFIGTLASATIVVVGGYNIIAANTKGAQNDVSNVQEVNELRQMVEDTQSKVVGLEERVTELEGKVVALESSNQEKDETISSLQNTVSKLKNTNYYNKNIKTDVDSLKTESETRKVEIEKKTARINEIKARLEETDDIALEMVKNETEIENLKAGLFGPAENKIKELEKRCNEIKDTGIMEERVAIFAEMKQLQEELLSM